MSEASKFIVFNSDKKIVQLTKVIGNLKEVLSEHFYQREYIEKFYGDEFDKIYQDHENFIKDTNDKIESEKHELEQNLTSLYEDQLNNLRDKLNHTVQDFTKKINDDSKVCFDELKKLQKDLIEINKTISEIQDRVSEPLSDIFSSSTKGGIQTMIEKNNKEIRLHDQEAEKKYLTYKKEIQDRMNSYETSYKKSVENLTKQFHASSKNAEMMKTIKELNQRYIALKNNMLPFQETVISQKEAFRSNITQFKNDFQREVDRYSKDMAELNKIRDDLKNKLEIIQNSNNPNVDILTADFEKMRVLHVNELTSLQTTLAQLLLNNKVELENMNNSIASNKANSNEEFEKLQKQYSKEYEELNNKYDVEFSTSSENMKKRQVTLDEQLKAFLNHQDQFFQQYQKNEIEHRIEIERLKKEYENDLALEEEKIQSVIQDKNKNHELYQSLHANFENGQKELDELEKEKASLIETFENSVKQIEDSLTLEQNDLNMLNEKELNELKENEEKDFLEFQQQLENQILENQNAFQSMKEKFISDSDAAYQNMMKKIPELFKNDGVVKNFLDENTEKYKKALEFLSSLDAESDDPNEIELKDKAIKELIDEKMQLSESIIKDRPLLQKKWEDFIDDEEKRHEILMKSYDLSSYDAKLNDYQNDVKNKIENLDYTYNKLLIELKIISDINSGIITTEYIEDDEIAKLRTHFEQLREELKMKRYGKKAELEKEVLEKNEEIEKASKQFADDIESEKILIKKKIEEAEEEFQNLQEKQNVNYQNSNAKFHEQIQQNQETIKELKLSLDEKLKIILELIKKEKIDSIKLQTELNNELGIERNKLEKLADDQIENESQILMSLRDLLDEKNKNLDALLKEAQDTCEKAKEKAGRIPMRPEEKEEIERLEGILDIKTQELSSLAKDMMKYKAHLQKQEVEVNKRFGVSPQVAILGNNGHGGKMQSKSAAVIKKPLVPPKNSFVC